VVSRGDTELAGILIEIFTRAYLARGLFLPIFQRSQVGMYQQLNPGNTSRAILGPSFDDPQADPAMQTRHVTL